VATNTLVFGSLAPAVPLTERFPVDDLAGNFYKLLFTAPGYALSRDPFAQFLTLSAGIEASHDTGVVNIDHDIILGAPQTFSLSGKGALRMGLNNSIRAPLFPRNATTSPSITPAAPETTWC
jgi:hypothetical protein